MIRYHTSILRYLINNEDVHFAIPFSTARHSYVKRDLDQYFLATVSKITGVADVFVLTIYFAAFCLSACSCLFILLFGTGFNQMP